MKNLQRVILIIIAITVFFTGIGVTMINFCCSSCSEQTLVMAQKHTCCSQTQTQVNDNHNSCCPHTNSTEKSSYTDTSFDSTEHCSSFRLSIDIDASSFRPQVANPFVWLSETLVNTLSYTQPSMAGDTKDYTHLKNPSVIPPREYLSLMRVLII